MRARRPIRTTWQRGVAAAIGGAVLALGGCTSAGTSATTTTLPRATTTVPPPGQAQLGTIVVQPGDLPSGWAASPAVPPANPQAESSALSQCVGTSATAGDVVAVAYSPNFTMGSQAVSAVATSFRTRGDVPADTKALLDPKAPSCLEEFEKARLSAELPARGKVRSYTVKVMAGTNGLAPNVAAVQMSSATYSTGGRSVTLDTLTVYLIAPRIETRVDFRSIGKAIPATVRAQVINRVSQRVTNGS